MKARLNIIAIIMTWYFNNTSSKSTTHVNNRSEHLFLAFFYTKILKLEINDLFHTIYSCQNKFILVFNTSTFFALEKLDMCISCTDSILKRTLLFILNMRTCNSAMLYATPAGLVQFSYHCVNVINMV